METKTYKITVKGCDASTTIYRQMTNEQYELLLSLAESITQESTYECMPTMSIELRDKGRSSI